MTSSNFTEKLTTSMSKSFCNYVSLQGTGLVTSSKAVDYLGALFKNVSNEHSNATLVSFNCLLLVVAVGLIYKIWQVLFSPLDVFHDVGTIGYVHHDTRISKQKSVNMARRQRNVGDIPPVYPNGWFRLMDSCELTKGQLKSVFAIGEHLAVFRNHSGTVRVLDAECPHMGTNMAAGGRVVGTDCLQCPFHGWSFSGDNGECVDIPYATKIPKMAAVRTWPVAEKNGVIYMWYHCDKEEPAWSIPKISNLSKLKYVGRTEHIVNCHVQEIPENAADFAHLGHLHKPVIGRDVENTYGPVWNFVQHDIEATWKLNEDLKHSESASMRIRDATHLKLWGFRIPMKTFHFNIEQIGPGNVHIYMNTPYFRGILIQTITPIEPLLQRLCHSFYIQPLVPMFLAKIFFYLEATQIERDIMVWNNKSYRRNPLLLKEESAIAKHRRWYKQFYTANSPKLNSSGTCIINPTRTDVSDW